MNQNKPSPLPQGEGPQPAGSAPAVSPTRPPPWVRQFLARNPFYLVSAALLLFGINRLSVDPTFLTGEEPKLAFNFAALQLYEILVVFVAILLGVRRVWYDSTLLVVLENMFLLVPFILVTQAILIGKGLAAALCVGGTLFAVARWDSLHRWIPQLRVPRAVLGCGALLLGLNVALPLVFRPIIEADVANWELPGQTGWFAVVPLLALLANLLPRPKEYSDLPPRKSWLPLLIFAIWITGSAVHLWCVGYVAGRDFNFAYLVPLLWVAAWTLCNRIADLQEKPSPDLRFVLLHFPLVIPFFALLHRNGHVSFTLTALNVVIYGALVLSHKERAHAFQILLICCAGLAASLPTEWGAGLLQGFDRAKALCLGMGVYVVIQSVLSRNPAIGLCGAVVAALGPVLILQKPLWNEALQIGCTFFLLHSYSWRDQDVKQVSLSRFVTAAALCVHAIAWTHGDETFARVTVSSAAVAILAGFFAFRALRGYFPPVVLALAGSIALCATPINFLIALLLTSPVGLLSILGSFVLFGTGTIFALNKHRWHMRQAPASEQEK
jgi:hypothetical protein